MSYNWFEHESRKDDLQISQQLTWIDHNPYPALITDKYWTILRMNPAFSMLSGYTAENLPDKNITALINPENVFPVESAYGAEHGICQMQLHDGQFLQCNIARKTIQLPGSDMLRVITLTPLKQMPVKGTISGATSVSELTNHGSDENFKQQFSYYSGDINFITSPNGAITSTSSTHSFNGIKPTVGENLFTIFPGKLKAFFKTADKIPPGSLPLIHEDFITINGEQKYIEFRIFPLDQEHFGVSLRDISRQKQLQRELLQTKERLDVFQHHSGIGSWDATLCEQPEVTTWNYFETLEITHPGSEISVDHLNHKHLVHPEDVAAYDKIMQQVKNSNPPVCEVDYRIIDRKSKIRFLHVESYLQYDTLRKKAHWKGTIHDLTQQRRAGILYQSASTLSQLLNPQHDVTLLMEAIHRIIASLIPASDMQVALVEEANSTLQFPYCTCPDGEPDPLNAMQGLTGYVIKSGKPLLADPELIEMLVKERSITHTGAVPVSWIGIPLKTHDKVLGVLSLQSFANDVVYGEDDKNLLLFISEQITLAIHKIVSEKALIKAKNEAEDSSRLKSSLLANMSHELRTPMTGILGFSEILHEEIEDARMKSMASTIYKSAGRLMSTLNSIIDLSAIEADKNTLNLKAVNTRLLFNPLLKVAHSIASDKGLYLRTSLPPSLHVLADEKMLGQMLHHLLDNALKFTIDGGISISAYHPSKASEEVLIRISDTGIGIAPEHHKMIFEEFRQVSEGFSRTFEGSGLGLSLCTKIARMLNARIWVESVQEKGSDFYVALPLAIPEIDETALDTETADIIRTHRLSRSRVPEVLIVEDNEINRRLAALYLREICNTEMAENGYVALEKIKRKKYDAILMDINLGAGPDGLTIANQARKSEINRETPIIAVTGYTMQGDREKLLSNGCSHYIPKPYDKKSLLKLFSGILYG